MNTHDIIPSVDASLSLSPYLTSLNLAQRQAVEHSTGPLLVLAGAGTGKTRVLIARIVHIIMTHAAFPGQILAVTFTNKAAREMRERLDRSIASQGMWLGTFHSIAARILRQHAELVGLQDNFIIIDSDDQLRLIKSVMALHAIDDKHYAPKAMSAIIQRWKDAGLGPSDVSSSYLVSPFHEVAHRIYGDYQQQLIRNNSADFGDLILHNLTLFRRQPLILAQYQQRFSHILVDEYQDTNIAQYLWMRMLAQATPHICCVGDDDQSIYGWRGAEVGNILRFERDFPGSHIVRLEQNYRSTPFILEAAASVISHNETRLGKTLVTDRTDGEKVKVVALWTDQEEANYAASEIAQATAHQGISRGDCAILVRAGFQTRAFEESLMRASIPYKVIGGLRFYERAEIRDVIAYIRAALNPRDNLAFERIVNLPKRGIGDSTLQKLRHHGRSYGLSLQEAVQDMLASKELRGKAADELSRFVILLKEWREAFMHSPHRDVIERIIIDSGYRAMWEKQRSLEAEGRLENLKELLNAVEEYESIQGFLDHVSMVMDIEESQGAEAMVSIMTLHAAKGLEFERVFLPGWEEGIFPHQRALNEADATGLEEERRLAYVGITRAKASLTISYAARRRVYHQWQNNPPSRFIRELPESAIEHVMGYNDNYSASRPQAESRSLFQDTSYASYHYQGYRSGDEVQHATFGCGIVVRTEGEHCVVNFDKVGQKVIVSSYLTRAR